MPSLCAARLPSACSTRNDILSSGVVARQNPACGQENLRQVTVRIPARHPCRLLQGPRFRLVNCILTFSLVPSLVPTPSEIPMNQRALRHFASISILMFSILMLSVASFAQQSAPAQDTPKDTLTRIFTGEFSERPAPPPRWFDGGQSYIAMEPAAGGPGRDLVKYDTATGKNREVLISAAQLTPEDAKQPLDIAGLSWSKDNERVLIFTNTRRVWRTNSRGDYWFLDRKAGKLKKMGGDAPEASLMYAKFNPDTTKVAYVKKNDIYVEDLSSGEIQRITHDGTDLILNGGSDWVNEEELALHDCFRWSPDGKRIAFWQFDLHGVGDFALMYYLGKEREITTDIPYPQTGPHPVDMQVAYPFASTTK